MEDPANALAVIHVPPVGTGLDLARELGPNLSIKMSAGGGADDSCRVFCSAEVD